jgi:predicted trehalose synthase
MPREFQVQALAVERQASTIAGRKGFCGRVAAQWHDAAAKVVTGDPALDRQTAEVAATAVRLGQALGEVMEALADCMNAVATNYRTCDVDTAAGFQRLRLLVGRTAGRPPGEEGDGRG